MNAVANMTENHIARNHAIVDVKRKHLHGTVVVKITIHFHHFMNHVHVDVKNKEKPA